MNDFFLGFCLFPVLICYFWSFSFCFFGVLGLFEVLLVVCWLVGYCCTSLHTVDAVRSKLEKGISAKQMEWTTVTDSCFVPRSYNKFVRQTLKT